MRIVNVIKKFFIRYLDYWRRNKFNSFLQDNNVLFVKGKVKGVSNMYIYNQGSILINGEAWLNSFPNGSPFKVALCTYNKHAIIEIGNKCKLNGCILHANESIKIGEDCRIGPGSVLCDNDSHKVALTVDERAGVPDSAPIILENNVWIGMNCIVLKGVHIAENTIVAAGSVVTKSCMANSIYAGNPAKWIKYIEK